MRVVLVLQYTFADRQLESECKSDVVICGLVTCCRVGLVNCGTVGCEAAKLELIMVWLAVQSVLYCVWSDAWGIPLEVDARGLNLRSVFSCVVKVATGTLFAGFVVPL